MDTSDESQGRCLDVVPGSGGGTLLGGVRKEVQGRVWGQRVVWVAWVAGGIITVAGPGAKQVGEGWGRARLPGREADKDGGDGGRKSERPLGTWISSSATMYTPSGATNDKSFSMDPTKFSLAMECFLAGCAKRSGAGSGVDESSG